MAKKLQIIVELNETGQISLQIPSVLPIVTTIGALEMAKDIILNGELKPAEEEPKSEIVS